MFAIAFYQQLSAITYKKEADQVVLARVNSAISHSFDSSYSREDIRKALLDDLNKG